ATRQSADDGSWNQPHDRRTKPGRDWNRQSLPNARGKREQALVWRWRRRTVDLLWLAGALIPPELLVTPAPLPLELVRSAVRRAPAEIEEACATANCVAHQLPVHEHVRRHGVVRAKRRGPCNLELAVPKETAAACHGLAVVIGHREASVR